MITLEFVVGFLLGLAYMTIGIGIARTQPKLSLLVIFLWPIAITVLAATGEIHGD
jgi:drug/metabolite transporter (DMT)-like permease